MKKILCILLALLLTMSLWGCQKEKQAVATPTTWEQINAIPVATDDMTEEALRQICLDFFRLQLSFQWSPKESFSYTITTYKEPREFSAGTVYAGLPYQGSSRSGNLYLAMEYYDPKTGVLDNTGIDGQELSHILGNHCTSSPYWAWSRVVTSVSHYANTCMTEHYGFLPVGNYTYTTMQWSENARTRSVCQENGEQVMFESYALLKPADGIFLFYSLGGNSHCRMVSAAPVVVRNADGTINPEESYILYMDQGSGLKDYTAADGTKVQLQGKIDEKATFRELFDKSYVPFTFAEFTGDAPVKVGKVTTTLTAPTTIEAVVGDMLTANYPISYAEVTLTDEDGKVSYRKVTPAQSLNVWEMPAGKLMDTSQVRTLLEKGPHTLRIRLRIGSGQLLTAYEGPINET